jgi:uncharacterized membrane protein YcaP (DUF421 family)
MGGTGVIDHFLEVFTRYIDSGFGLLGGEVAFVATTLIVIDVTLSLLQRAYPPLSKVFNGEPMIVVEEGRPLLARLERARLTADQVLESGRRIHGLERMDEIKYAILEASGEISIIPYARHKGAA